MSSLSARGLRGARPVLCMLVVASTAFVLAGCGGDGEPNAGEPTSTMTTPPGSMTPATSEPGGTSSSEPTTSPSETSEGPADAVVISVKIADGQVTVARDTFEVTYGQTVTLNVTTDVADKVDVPGFNVTRDIVPDVLNTVIFKVKRSIDPGVYEVETQGSKLLLLKIEVR